MERTRERAHPQHARQRRAGFQRLHRFDAPAGDERHAIAHPLDLIELEIEFSYFSQVSS